jgi:hypothetical protein
MHSLYRALEKFVVGVNVMGVSNLVERMGSKSESYRRTFAEQKGFGGYAYEELERYIERSPGPPAADAGAHPSGQQRHRHAHQRNHAPDRRPQGGGQGF